MKSGRSTRGHARRGVAHRGARVVRRRHRRTVPPGRRGAGRHARRAARHRAGARPPAAPAGTPRRDRLQRWRARDPRLRRVRGRRPRGAGALGRDPGRRCAASSPPTRPSRTPSTSSPPPPPRPTSERSATVLADPDIDAVIVIFVPPLVTDSDDVARAIVSAVVDAGSKPIVACFLTQANAPEILQAPDDERRTIPCFTFPEAAAVALGHAARPRGVAPPARGRGARPPRHRPGQGARHRGGRAGTTHEEVWLDPEPAIELCRAVRHPGRAAPPRRLRRRRGGRGRSELGYPVAMKAGSGAIVHKTDVGGVALGLENAGRGATCVHRHDDGPRRRARRGRASNRWSNPGSRRSSGVTQDPRFGPLVLFGMGGIGAELVRDTALRLLPLTDLDAADLVRSLRSSPLLFGYRGRACSRRRRARRPAAARRPARRRDPRAPRARLQPGRRAARRCRRDRREDPPRPDARPPRCRRPPPPRPRLIRWRGSKVTRNSIEPLSSTVAGPPLGESMP